MRDVAALAGVSIKTVSRVVNDEQGVSPVLTGRVLSAVRMLGYRHNLSASSLRRTDRKTRTVGVLLDDVSNPFSSCLARAVEEVVRSRGMLVFAGSSEEDADRQEELLHALLSRWVDGLIIIPVPGDAGALVRRHGLDIPVVFVDRPGPAGTDSVTVDNRNGAEGAVRHLTAAGHRRIAFLGDLASLWTATERHAGYVIGLASGGIPYDAGLVRWDLHSVEAAEESMLDLLDCSNRPTALFAAQNLVTIGATRALQRRGLQHRIAHVGFDDLMLADLLDPPVTVVAQDPAAIGRGAAELLLSRLDGDAGPARRLVVPTRLVIRGSGEIPA